MMGFGAWPCHIKSPLDLGYLGTDTAEIHIE